MWIILLCTCALMQCYDAKALLRSTVLQTMLEDPVLKNCNISLMEKSAAKFRESCNIEYNSDVSDVEEDALLLCLSYYDINRRLCIRGNNYIHHNLVELNTLFSNITAQNLSCASIQDKLAFVDLPKIQNYAVTLKSYLSDQKLCEKMCYTLKGHLKEFCEVFFWGNLLLSTEKQTDETTLHNNANDSEQIYENKIVTINELHTDYVNGLPKAEIENGIMAIPALSGEKEQQSSGLATSAEQKKTQPLIEKLKEKVINSYGSSPSEEKKNDEVLQKSGIDQKDPNESHLVPNSGLNPMTKESSLEKSVIKKDHEDQTIADMAKVGKIKTEEPLLHSPAVGNNDNKDNSNTEEKPLPQGPAVGDNDNKDKTKMEEKPLPQSPAVGNIDNKDKTKMEEKPLPQSPAVGNIDNKDKTKMEEKPLPQSPAVGNNDNKDKPKIEENPSPQSPAVANNNDKDKTKPQEELLHQKPAVADMDDSSLSQPPVDGDGDYNNNYEGEEEHQKGNVPNNPIQAPHSPDNSNIVVTGSEDILNEDADKKGFSSGSIPPNEDLEESHFFSMFLTLVGLSALVYILFHNKNKILGLLVEGRVHSTRRRGNHAYRRLDTLEHAVSAPAPPASKAAMLY